MGMAIIVHGGAGAIPLERREAARAGCHEAVVAGWEVLRAGGSAMDAIQAAIVAMENNPSYNAGTGAVLTAEGRAELDSGIMDGQSLQAGAVAGVARIKNPILLARMVLESPHVLLIGAGAEQFALESGVALCDPRELITPAQYARWQQGYRAGDDVNLGPSAAMTTATATATARHPGLADETVHDDGHEHGTVGAVAVDAQGRVAAGASTGGIAAKHPGRVGDTPLVGAGFYAESPAGGASSTGHGEDFIRLLLAKRAVDYLAAGIGASAAAERAIQVLAERAGGHGGIILLDGDGQPGFARNTGSMAFAYMRDGMAAPESGV
jgi:beta-aspartyl-peptidase (threonine type)